ncbi:MAG: hypothetical protein DRG30_05110 [Epsilonproteobacteria bacterium]|nr:MAG: hypothetical protein DRG30_05110 [Campylobacterota bacterium]
MAPNNNVKKALAIVLIMDSLLDLLDSRNLRLVSLGVSLRRAIDVYRTKANASFYDVEASAKKVWVHCAQNTDIKLDTSDVANTMEMLLTLLPKKDMSVFIGRPLYVTTFVVEDEVKKKKILDLVLMIDERLGEAYGVPLVTSVEKLNAILNKPAPVKKVKKTRDKATPSNIKKIRKRIKYARKVARIAEEEKGSEA